MAAMAGKSEGEDVRTQAGPNTQVAVSGRMAQTRQTTTSGPCNNRTRKVLADRGKGLSSERGRSFCTRNQHDRNAEGHVIERQQKVCTLKGLEYGTDEPCRTYNRRIKKEGRRESTNRPAN